jgi:uncharacterized tellurite resistance protein B-like protein
MGISDLYLTIGQRRNLSHFANIVRIAKSDRQISSEEIAFLNKVSKKYNISIDDFKMILKDPEKVPTIAHLECIERIERLYELLLMVRADHEIRKEEVEVLKKIATGLAFPLHKVDQLVEASMKIDVEKTDLEDFTNLMLDFLHMKH